MRNSESIATLLQAPVEWYERGEAPGWSMMLDGHVGVLKRLPNAHFQVKYRDQIQDLAALPPQWVLRGEYAAPAQSFTERGEQLAQQLIAAADGHPALSHGAQLAVWDRNPSNGDWVGEYDVGVQGARLVRHRIVTAAEREQIERSYVQQQIRQGATYQASVAVWAFDTEAFVWTATSLRLHGNQTTLQLGFRTIARNNVRAVASFGATADVERSGVQLQLQDGSDVVVVEAPDVETAWASTLGQELAAWLGVPHHDDAR